MGKVNIWEVTQGQVGTVEFVSFFQEHFEVLLNGLQLSWCLFQEVDQELPFAVFGILDKLEGLVVIVGEPGDTLGDRVETEPRALGISVDSAY